MDHQLTYYIERYTTGTITSEELRFFSRLLQEPVHREAFKEAMQNSWNSWQQQEMDFPEVTKRVEEALLTRIARMELPSNTVDHRIYPLRRWWIAACVIFVISIGAYFWTSDKKNTSPTMIAQQNLNIAPGKQGAILTLTDGRQIVLDSLENGLVAEQQGAKIILQNGQVTYALTGAAKNELTYNTMTTPKGRQFTLMLPDGTRVWLNAASSIRYPTVFNDEARQVEVTGEVYFEVAKITTKPFLVNVVNRTEIEVLGTHFNVNAYENERVINTTLLDGAVKVTQIFEQTCRKRQSIKSVVLKPGQQARVADSISVINNTDLSKVMAWKNGLFNFEDATLEEIMRQLERWYDIEVVFESHVPNIPVMGKITRDVPLSGLLINLGKMGVRYKLEGRRLTVLP